MLKVSEGDHPIKSHDPLFSIHIVTKTKIVLKFLGERTLHHHDKLILWQSPVSPQKGIFNGWLYTGERWNKQIFWLMDTGSEFTLIPETKAPPLLILRMGAYGRQVEWWLKSNSVLFMYLTPEEITNWWTYRRRRGPSWGERNSSEAKRSRVDM